MKFTHPQSYRIDFLSTLFYKLRSLMIQTLPKRSFMYNVEARDQSWKNVHEQFSAQTICQESAIIKSKAQKNRRKIRMEFFPLVYEISLNDDVKLSSQEQEVSLKNEFFLQRIIFSRFRSSNGCYIILIILILFHVLIRTAISVIVWLYHTGRSFHALNTVQKIV